MYFLLANDFYSDWELIKSDSIDNVERYIKSQGENMNGIVLIDNSDDSFLPDVSAYDYKTIFITDYIDG